MSLTETQRRSRRRVTPMRAMRADSGPGTDLVPCDPWADFHEHDEPGSTEWKFRGVVRTAYLIRLAMGGRRGSSARAVNVSPGHVRKYIAAHPEFAEKVRLAESEGVDKVYDVLYDMAANERNLQAIALYLRTRPPEKPEQSEQQIVEEESLVYVRRRLSDPDEAGAIAWRVLTDEVAARRARRELESGA